VSTFKFTTKLVTTSPGLILHTEKSRNFRKLDTRTRQFITVFHSLSKEQTGLLVDFVLSSLFFVSVHSNLRNGDTEVCHEGLIRWKIVRRQGINNQNVLIQYVVGAYRTDTVVSLTPKPVMFL
jgi:hypothetical protein